MTKETPTNVTIVDRKLILSLPNAQMPVIWQADLEKAQSSAFTIQEDKKAKTFVLILKTKGEEVDEIAHFDNKQASVDVLMEISQALQGAHGQIKPNDIVSNSNAQAVPASSNNTRDNKIGAILSLVLVLVLILIWVIFASNNVNLGKHGANDFAHSNTNSQGSSGVAISADDFLNNR